MCHFDHKEKSYLFNILHMKYFSLHGSTELAEVSK